MEIFPSQNDKNITIAIVSTCIGMAIGFIARSDITDKNILITSIATLSAAFFGAWLSFKLQENRRKREEQNMRTQQSNELLFALYQKLNALKLFQIDSVEPWRGKPEALLGMQPLLDYKLPETKIRPESISFLLGTKYEQLLFEIHIEDERFKVAENIIKFRSNLHFNHIQPAMHASGIIDGAEYTSSQYKNAIGEMLYKQLEKATNDVIYNVDKTVASSDKLGKKILKALKETYPNEKFVHYILLNELPNKANQHGQI